MDIVLASIDRIFNGMPHFAVLLIGLYLAKLLFHVTSPFDFNDELTEKDNPAFGVYLGGYLFGAAIALTGAMYHAGESLLVDMQNATFGIIVTIIFMRLSIFVNHKVILSKFSVVKEVSKDRNSGTGFVVAGSAIATGLMLNGMLSGTSASWLLAVRDIAVYWTIGQLLLILGGVIFQWITSYDVHKIIEDDDNMPAGIGFGGFLVAIGIIVRNGLIGAGSNLSEEIFITLMFAIVGILLLIPTHTIVDRILLPASPLSKEIEVDKNPAAGIIAAVSFIAVALIYTAAVNVH